jgi:hypothetical protein
VLEAQVAKGRVDADKHAMEAAELRREAGRLRGENTQLRERAVEAEAHADKLRKQLAAKSVLSAEHMQLEAKVRGLTDALGLRSRQLEDVVRENERLRAASGVPADASVVPLSPQRSGTASATTATTSAPFTERSDSIEGLVADMPDALRFAEPVLRPAAHTLDAASRSVATALRSSPGIRLGALLYAVVLQLWWVVCVLRGLVE